MSTRVTLAFVLAALPALAIAAPVPGDGEKPKPRPKLVGTARCDVNVIGTTWTPDGKHLLLRCGNGTAMIVSRDQFTADEPALKPVAEITLPTGGTHLALSASGSELYSVVSARRFNSESRLYIWDLKRVLEAKEPPKADRVVTLEPDGPNFGSLSGDGKQLLTHTLEVRPGGQANPNFRGERGQGEYTARFVKVSTKTGDVSGEVAVYDDSQLRYIAHAVDPKAGRLFVVLYASDETVVRCLDSSNGKQVWERKLTPPPSPNTQSSVLVSPDGSLLGVVQSVQITNQVAQPGNPGARPQLVRSQRSIPVLLNAKTGETPLELAAEDVQLTTLSDFSHDGRLLIGSVSKDGGATQTVVWDTTTGKVVKAWTGSSMRRGVGMTVAFAQNGYNLAVSEVESSPVYGPTTAIPQGYGQGGQQWTTTREITRTDYKTVIGIWDLSSLVK